MGCLQGHAPLEYQWWPELVVLAAPAIGQELGLRHRGEQFSVEEFITEPAVDGFGKAVLQRGALLGVKDCGALIFAIVP